MHLYVWKDLRVWVGMKINLDQAEFIDIISSRRDSAFSAAAWGEGLSQFAWWEHGAKDGPQ